MSSFCAGLDNNRCQKVSSSNFNPQTPLGNTSRWADDALQVKQGDSPNCVSERGTSKTGDVRNEEVRQLPFNATNERIINIRKRTTDGPFVRSDRPSHLIHKEDEITTIDKSNLSLTTNKFVIPLPSRKYTTTNPGTLSPIYHLIYDLTSPVCPSPHNTASPSFINPSIAIAPGNTGTPSSLTETHLPWPPSIQGFHGQVDLSTGVDVDVNVSQCRIRDGSESTQTKPQRPPLPFSSKFDIDSTNDSNLNYNGRGQHNLDGANDTPAPSHTFVDGPFSFRSGHEDNTVITTHQCDSSSFLSKAGIVRTSKSDCESNSHSGVKKVDSSQTAVCRGDIDIHRTGVNEVVSGSNNLHYAESTLLDWATGISPCNQNNNLSLLSRNESGDKQSIAFHKGSGLNAVSVSDKNSFLGSSNGFDIDDRTGVKNIISKWDNKDRNFEIVSRSEQHSQVRCSNEIKVDHGRAVFQREGDGVRLFLVQDDRNKSSSNNEELNDSHNVNIGDTKSHGKENLINKKFGGRLADSTPGVVSQSNTSRKEQKKARRQKERNTDHGGKSSLKPWGKDKSSPNCTLGVKKNPLNRWEQIHVHSGQSVTSPPNGIERQITQNKDSFTQSVGSPVAEQSVPLLTQDVTNCGVSNSQWQERGVHSPIRDARLILKPPIKGILVNKESGAELSEQNKQRGQHLLKQNGVHFLDDATNSSLISHSITSSRAVINNNSNNGTTFSLNANQSSLKEVIDRNKYIIKPKSATDHSPINQRFDGALHQPATDSVLDNCANDLNKIPNQSNGLFHGNQAGIGTPSIHLDRTISIEQRRAREVQNQRSAKVNINSNSSYPGKGPWFKHNGEDLENIQCNVSGTSGQTYVTKTTHKDAEASEVPNGLFRNGETQNSDSHLLETLSQTFHGRPTTTSEASQGGSVFPKVVCNCKGFNHLVEPSPQDFQGSGFEHHPTVTTANTVTTATVGSNEDLGEGEYTDTLKYKAKLKEALKKSSLLNLYGADQSVEWIMRRQDRDNSGVYRFPSHSQVVTDFGPPTVGRLLEKHPPKITPRQKFEILHNRVSRKVATNLRHNTTHDDKQSSLFTNFFEAHSHNNCSVVKQGDCGNSTNSFYKESPRAKFERDRAAKTHAINPQFQVSHSQSTAKFNKSCDDLDTNTFGYLNSTYNKTHSSETLTIPYLDSEYAAISPRPMPQLSLTNRVTDVNGILYEKNEINVNKLPVCSLRENCSINNDISANLLPPKPVSKISDIIENKDFTGNPDPTARLATEREQRGNNVKRLGLRSPHPSAKGGCGTEGEGERFWNNSHAKETLLTSHHASLSSTNKIDITSPHSCVSSIVDAINTRSECPHSSGDIQRCISKPLNYTSNSCVVGGHRFDPVSCQSSLDIINTNSVPSRDLVSINPDVLERCVCSISEKCPHQQKSCLEIPKPVQVLVTKKMSPDSVSSSGYESEHTVFGVKHLKVGDIRNDNNTIRNGDSNNHNANKNNICNKFDIPRSTVQELRFRFNSLNSFSRIESESTQRVTSQWIKSDATNQQSVCNPRSHSSGDNILLSDDKYDSSASPRPSPRSINDRETSHHIHNCFQTDINNNFNKNYQNNSGPPSHSSKSRGNQNSRGKHQELNKVVLSMKEIIHDISAHTSTSGNRVDLNINNCKRDSHRYRINKEAAMLASKGLRIYEDSNNCLLPSRQTKPSLDKTVSEPKVSWEAASYLIVPTVVESFTNGHDVNATSGLQSTMFDVLAHRSISDSVTNENTDSKDEINNGAHSDGDVCSDNEYISMSCGPSPKMRARAMSVDLICKDTASEFNQEPSKDHILNPNVAKVSTRIRRKDRRPSRGYVEWKTCSGWIGGVDMTKRNSRGYVEWDTIWSPAVASKGDGSGIEDEHVYDVIQDEQTAVLVQEEEQQPQPTTTAPTAVTSEPTVDSEESDVPPALPERTYINRIKRNEVSTKDGSQSHSPHCHHHQRQNNNHHHHHHHHHHHSSTTSSSSHRHHHRHTHSPSGRRCHGSHHHKGSSSSSSSSKLKSSNKPPPPLPPSHPPPLLPSSHPPQQPDISQDYAQVSKLKGYTFGNLMTSQEPACVHQTSDKSAVYSENYWHLQPVTSEERMTLWKPGDVLNYIDGLHESMSPKSRENIYILLNNKKTRAKFSESLEIESRLLSRGLLSASVDKVDINASSNAEDPGSAVSKTQKEATEKKKRTKVPVTSTYV